MFTSPSTTLPEIDFPRRILPLCDFHDIVL
jgi:hypothetical protein